MLGFKSARGRAIASGTLLLLVLASVATLAIWRAGDDQQQHHTLEHTSSAALALEHVHAEFHHQQALLSTLIFSDDPTLVDQYHEATLNIEQYLSEARAEALARGEADEVVAIDNLTYRTSHFDEQVNLALPLLPEADLETKVQMATVAMSEMVPESNALIADLEELSHEAQEELAASRAAADRAADTTLWLLIGFSAVAFLVAAGTVSMLIVSLVRPLAALRASALAITSGDPEARANVSGPEEVASLARAFNEMTDALAAKTQEYIDTTNMTGDIIVRLDERGRWILLNDAACQFFGKPREELLGVQSRDYVHPEDIASTTQAIRETRARKELVRGFVHRFLTAMGTRVVEWNAYPLFDEEGQYTGTQITGRDVTERKQMEDALQESEARYKALFAGAPEGMLVADSQTRQFRYANPAMCMMFGYTEEELLRIGVADIHPKESLDHALADFEAQARGEKRLSPGLPCLRKDGTLFYADIRSITVVLDGRKCSVGIFSDVTERKKAEQALQESEARYRLLAENTSDLIWTMDLGLRYTYMSPAITRMRGYTAEEIVGVPIKETMTPASLEVARKTLAEQLAIESMGSADPNRSTKLELEMYCKDGSTIWTEMNMVFLRDPDGKPVGILGVTRNITERKRMEEERERLHAELQVKAITDSLTDLYNHAHFFQRLAEEIERCKRYGRGFTVVMMDVDNFKQYNDSHGHQAGDKALRLIADCIRTAIRRSDIAFRYGGDEFAAILLHADSSRAQAIAKRMNGCLTRRLKESDDPAAAWLGLSAGVACFPQDGTTADDLVKVADTALYDAKRLVRARAATALGQAIEPLASPSETPDDKQSRALSAAASSLATILRDASLPDALVDLDLRTVAAVATAAEIKDPYVRDHQQRVSQWAAALADEMGLPPEDVQDIRTAGLLHDLGKVSVSEHILNKPGKLTEEEYAKIKEHSALGAGVIAHIEGLQHLVKMVRHHHERFDGKGYPDGLAGKDIPLEARILAVADVFDAMTHERSYRKALSREKALAELERGAGTQFDPAVVKSFLALLQKRGAKPPAPAQAATKHRQLAAAGATGRGKG